MGLLKGARSALGWERLTFTAWKLFSFTLTHLCLQALCVWLQIWMKSFPLQPSPSQALEGSRAMKGTSPLRQPHRGLGQGLGHEPAEPREGTASKVQPACGCTFSLMPQSFISMFLPHNHILITKPCVLTCPCYYFIWSWSQLTWAFFLHFSILWILLLSLLLSIQWIHLILSWQKDRKKGKDSNHVVTWQILILL